MLISKASGFRQHLPFFGYSQGRCEACLSWEKCPRNPGDLGSPEVCVLVLQIPVSECFNPPKTLTGSGSFSSPELPTLF